MKKPTLGDRRQPALSRRAAAKHHLVYDRGILLSLATADRRPARRLRRILDNAHVNRPLTPADDVARLDAVWAIHGPVIGTATRGLKRAL